MTVKRKNDPPLHLDMDPDEALRRFLQTDPAELDEQIERSKAAKPKPGGPRSRKASASDPSGSG
jgi:hypothetical protein